MPFVAVALVSTWCPSARMHDLFPLVWSRSGAPMIRSTICCCCFGFEVGAKNAMVNDLLPLVWSRSVAIMLGLRFAAVALVCM